ncbi:MAG: SDR family oxidoreductase [Ruminococcaceae bacterium]|nr:SDR family oxidoreductase [Oscillospiraceae bacterium]
MSANGRKVLVTGSEGFIGKNLISKLMLDEEIEILKADIDTDIKELDEMLLKSDFVVHLAGVNRPKDAEEFYSGNSGLTGYIAEKLLESKNRTPVLMTSSIHSDTDSDYGKSKRLAEEILFDYSKKSGAGVFVYKLPNVFGKWSRPNYNSAVATFCYNISREIPIDIDDREKTLNLVYIDDVIDSITDAVKGVPVKKEAGYSVVEKTYAAKLGEIENLLISFETARKTNIFPKLEGIAKPLYSTYLSFLEPDNFSYEPSKINSDSRGSFFEFFKTDGFGQFSVCTANPGEIRGNHWHHTKVEKFLVVEGEAVISFRKVFEDEITSIEVKGEVPEIVDIPAGYTHNIKNTGDGRLTFVIWANELFSPEKPDTFYLEV